MLGWLIMVLIVAGVGLGLRAYLKQVNADSQVSWLEFIGVVVISAALIIPLTSYVGTKVARGNLLRYDEFWNGYELQANRSATICTEDGPCNETYSCDPYLVTHTSVDSKGHVSTYVTTEYRSCPYVTREWHYSINSTLGNFDFPGVYFDPNPQVWRPSDGHGIPSDVPRGAPQLWLDAQRRIAAGTPGPVTAVRQYDNYILASSTTILKKYDGAIKRYQAKGLMPDPVANVNSPIHDLYYADKVQFVGRPAVAHSSWQFAVANFNAALGTAETGDLHVVIVNADKVDSPDDYTNAVNAWWQSKHLDKKALSKNGLGLVIGAKSGKVAWARAFTGMPVGNNSLFVQIRDQLKGLPLDPYKILGNPVGKIHGTKVTVQYDRVGALSQIMLGPNKFVRVHMLCDKKSYHCVGYKYLGSQIQPTSGQRFVIDLIAMVLSLGLWILATITVIGETSVYQQKKNPRSSDYDDLSILDNDEKAKVYDWAGSVGSSRKGR